MRLLKQLPVFLTLLLVATASPMAQAAGLLIADGGFGGVLEIEEHAVEVTINNGIAVTQVTQVFRNTERRQVEALYTFPVPKGASVANFSMWINGKEMTGEVIEKKRAREIYDSYKQQRRDPGLLEQVDYKTFELRIFPIGPEAEQRIEVTYYQELNFDDDWATYVYPLSTTTRENIDSRTRGRFAFNLEVASEVPIVDLESPSHGGDFVVAKHTPHHVQASLETTGGDLNRDLVLAYHLSRPQSGLDWVASKEPGEDGYVLLTLTAGEELGDVNEGMDYVFILDISGSMNDDGKLGLSRNSLEAFVDSLGEEDRFEVLTFNVAAHGLFSDLRAPDPTTRSAAADFLRRQQAKGGTFLEPALRSAYAYKDPDRVLNVVVLSDGMTEQRERATLLRLIGERPGSTRVFAIGVGNDVNRPLLEQLAEDAGGLAAFISRGDNFERQAKAFRRKLLRPAVTNLEIEAMGGGLYDVEPRTLPNLYHGMPVRLFGRYDRPGPMELKIQGDIGGELFERSLQVELPGDEADNPEIERMWAWHRVQRLLKDADRAGNRDQVVDEIVRLGEGYSIVTEYTSFLVLENDAEYQRWKIDRRNAARIERDRRKLQRVRAELESMRAKSASDVGPVNRAAARSDVTPPRPVAGARASAPAARPQPSRSSDRGFDLDFGGGGGGAFDPFTAGLVLSLGGATFAVYRRRRNRKP
jgi:Ca-activated chloride channel family protein